VLFSRVWLAASLGSAYLAKVVERALPPGRLPVGFPTWDKTVQTGKVDVPG
jgi:hypothetical protein